ncbi:MAG: NADH-ubiquinone oxidoreductase-F iron-sulfur binding region domain-containing protein [Candidatus Latescibacterota bacterium]|nr:NADH-ubiquinone oxidoreductase-F iron-sulfur binding region domain-containing protein [Candidatus Latescibacterota bacterium]
MTRDPQIDTDVDPLVEAGCHQPAPLLSVLHDLYDRDGCLSEDALRSVSKGLGIPLAELFGTVTFYHHFSRDERPGKAAPRVCTGPICCQHGARELLNSLRDQGATAMPCAGRCDQPVPVLRGDEVLIGTSVDELIPDLSPLPAPNPGGIEECVFAGIRNPGRATLEGYQTTGGYAGLETALGMSPEEIRTLITDSGLAGRGGAGFPTGAKWSAVADAPGKPKTIVCNADEGEPGCFKDRALLEYDPHAVIEGMIIAGLATGARQGFLYLRYEYPHALDVLKAAVAEAEEAGRLGDRVGDSGRCFHLYIRRGAGAYICGEEGSLLNSLEGKHPFPRNRPPYPVTHGYEDLPTAVNNVETLASVPPILHRGAQWYQSLGLGDRAGTKLISLSGDIQRPGNYEVPFGLPLRELLHDWAGGPPGGRRIQAVTMAGLSGGFLGGNDLEQATLDEDSIRCFGSFLGAGGIMVFDDSRDMAAVAHMAMEFFAEESCGKCFPCRIGTRRLTERLHREGPQDLIMWTSEVEDIGNTMMATSACGLGMAAPNITRSLLKYFPDSVERLLR